MILQNISVKLPAVITGTDHFTFRFYCSKELCRFPCYYYDHVVCGTELFISFPQCWMISLQIIKSFGTPLGNMIITRLLWKNVQKSVIQIGLFSGLIQRGTYLLVVRKYADKLIQETQKREGKRTHVNILTAAMILIIPLHYLNMKRSSFV